MMKHSIAAWYYPGTVVFIDDDEQYLTHLKLQLDNTQFSSKLFFNPQAALHFLEDYEPGVSSSRYLSQLEETDFDHRNLDIDIKAISQFVYNPNRFDEIPVVAIDYAMPKQNGLEIARWLTQKHPAIKIILLTGEADDQVAIHAFNEGIIHKFIRKNSKDFVDLLNTSISGLMLEYFSNLSKLVIDSLTKGLDQPAVSWLDDAKFVSLFHDVCKKNKIVEYYLTDASGSFLFLNDDAQPSWLACKNEDEMQAAYEIAVGSDVGFPPKLLTSMKDRKKILYLLQGGLSEDAKEAEHALHPATKLVGKKSTYYYSYINNPTAYDIHLEKILSYRSYLKKHA